MLRDEQKQRGPAHALVASLPFSGIRSYCKLLHTLWIGAATRKAPVGFASTQSVGRYPQMAGLETAVAFGLSPTYCVDREAV